MDLRRRLIHGAHCGVFQVRNRRSFKQSLYKFEISAVDQQRSGKQVMSVVCFRATRARHFELQLKTICSRHALHSVWKVGVRQPARHVFAEIDKPDELELGGRADDEQGEVETDPTLAAIHVGRHVPIIASSVTSY